MIFGSKREEEKRMENNHIEEPIIEYEKEDGISIMERPFDPTQIKIDTQNTSLDILIKRIRRESIQLNTETYFQRGVDLWDKTTQSRLIESILIRFPLPAFFFDATDDENWLVVDGLQRLSSIQNFVVNKSQPLSNLEFLTQLNGMYWDDLAENLQRVIEESQVVLYKIMPGTPSDVKFNIFKRINTGGLVLKPQEIRHALFQGIPAEFVYKLANIEEFKKATDGRIPSKRMEDRDFVNRFLGFYILGVENYGQKQTGLDLDSYMSEAMDTLHSKTEEDLHKIKMDFMQAMRLAHEIFGKEAFRKITEENTRLPPINKALFDALSTQFALLNEEESKLLIENKKEFRDGLRKALAQDEKFFASVTSSTGDKNRTMLRHKVVRDLISDAIK